MKNIILIGMPGSGKTTIGDLLSKKLNMKFIDMDKYIESMENKSVEEMFEISEKYFRDAETKAAKILSSNVPLVIATGGGIVKREENINFLKQNSIIIFINRPLKNIIKDIDISNRPLLNKNKNIIYDLYKERLHLYKKYCNIEVLNDKFINDTLNNLLKSLKNLGDFPLLMP